MAHYPLNHHLRRFYRFFAVLSGLYLLAFGVLGLARTWGDPFLHRGSDWVLGLRTNPAAAWIATVAGAILLAVILLGGNVYHRITMALGWGLCGYALLVMAFLQTDANVTNASMANVIALLILGMVLLTAGLYGKVGTARAADDEQSRTRGPR